MATYAELSTLINNSEFKAKIRIACIIAAEQISLEDNTTPNHANRLIWAAEVFKNPAQQAKLMMWPIVAAHKDVLIDTIRDVSDSIIQTKVDLAVDFFAGV